MKLLNCVNRRYAEPYSRRSLVRICLYLRTKRGKQRVLNAFTIDSGLTLLGAEQVLGVA